MIRRIQLTLRPSEALVALTALHAPPGAVPAAPGASSAATAFGPRLGQEVARAFDAHARALDVVAQCLDWLERRGLCEVERARARGGVREPTWRASAAVKLDVRALSRDVDAERDDPDSKARASAWAARMVLRHLAGSALHACEVRVGGERIPPAEALAAYDTELSLVGFGPHAAPPARLAHLARASRRQGEGVETSASPAPASAPKVEAARTKSTKPVPEEKPAGKPVPGAAPPPAPTTPKRPRVKEKPFAAGFGGLPDDAMPEDRRTGDVFSARGLTLDAEFFLTEAAIAQWPCDAATLERGRRAVVTRLHPDRAGEDSAPSFHRAIKGHAELAKKLPPPQPSAPSATATVGVATAVPAPTPAVPPAKPVDAAASVPPPAREKPARKPRSRARSEASPTTGEHPRAPAQASATRSTVRPIEPAPATTFEWPPRPVEVETPRARTA